MTGLAHLVAQALHARRDALKQALGAIRDYQAAVVALADLADTGQATSADRDWALTTAADLQDAWDALDRIRWSPVPFPGTRVT